MASGRSVVQVLIELFLLDAFICFVEFDLVLSKQSQVLVLLLLPLKLQDSKCAPPCLDLMGSLYRQPVESRMGLQSYPRKNIVGKM